MSSSVRPELLQKVASELARDPTLSYALRAAPKQTLRTFQSLSKAEVRELGTCCVADAVEKYAATRGASAIGRTTASRMRKGNWGPGAALRKFAPGTGGSGVPRSGGGKFCDNAPGGSFSVQCPYDPCGYVLYGPLGNLPIQFPQNPFVDGVFEIEFEPLGTGCSAPLTFPSSDEEIVVPFGPQAFLSAWVVNVQSGSWSIVPSNPPSNSLFSVTVVVVVSVFVEAPIGQATSLGVLPLMSQWPFRLTSGPVTLQPGTTVTLSDTQDWVDSDPRWAAAGLAGTYTLQTAFMFGSFELGRPGVPQSPGTDCANPPTRHCSFEFPQPQIGPLIPYPPPVFVDPWPVFQGFGAPTTSRSASAMSAARRRIG
jgi:hypothetical protein